MKIAILGAFIDNVTLVEAKDRVVEWLAQSEGKQHIITTPNPEMVMAAQNDEKLRQIINQSDLAIPDGIGLVWASRWLAKGDGRWANDSANYVLHHRVAGVDLMLSLCQEATNRGWNIGLLGGAPDVAKETAQVLKNKYPGINVVFAYAGDGGKQGDGQIRQRMVHSHIDLLFVAFGHSKQEKWIDRNLPHIPVRIAMGVGGAFDVVSGRKKRAPHLVQRAGLEWLWRLAHEPWRWKRQLALIKFMWLVLFAPKPVASSRD